MASSVRTGCFADEAVAARLYERYSKPLYRYCLRRLRSHEDAEDAVQNTFLRAHSALARGIVPDFEAGWLYKIAHNVCLSRRLGAARRGRVEAPADLQELEERLPGRATDGHEELFGLEDALAAMPENLRRAILLREWQGLSYAEIAEALDISQSAVETLIFRARRHLAQALDTNVKQPARRVAGALNLGWLANALRGLLTGAGGAKLAAAGLGLIAAGLAGGGYAVSQALSESSARSTEATALAATSVFVGAQSSAPSAGVAGASVSNTRGGAPVSGNASGGAPSGSA